MFRRKLTKFYLLYFLFCTNSQGYSAQTAIHSELKNVKVCEVDASLLEAKLDHQAMNSSLKWSSLFSQGELVSKNDVFTELDEALSLLNTNEVIFLDVRNVKQYQQYFIPTSMNYSAHQLKTKSHLRSKKIVLIDDGFREAHLLELQKTLSDSGFSQVKILRGGLYAWKQAGGELRGSNPNASDLNHIKPFDLLKLKMYQHWVVVDLDDWSSNKYKTKTEKLAYLDRIKLSDEKNMVITTNDGSGYTQIEKLTKELGLKNIYFLEGGTIAYETMLKKQQALWARTPGKQGGENRCGGRV